MTKVCKFCREEKDLELFEKDKRAPDKHSCRCLVCAKEIKRVSALKHRDERLERQRKYREEHPEEYKAEKHAEYIKNRDTYREYGKKYYEENKEQFLQMVNECRKRRYEKDPTKAIADILRSRIRSALMGICFSEETESMLGCDRETLKNHFESQFTEGMSWEKYGYYGWHIDHIKPCAQYDLTDDIQRRICFNYKNLRPLWKDDNMKKYYLWSEDDEAEWRKHIWPDIKHYLVAHNIINTSYEGC